MTYEPTVRADRPRRTDPGGPPRVGCAGRPLDTRTERIALGSGVGEALPDVDIVRAA
jgi:hypothetical protein